MSRILFVTAILTVSLVAFVLAAGPGQRQPAAAQTGAPPSEWAKLARSVNGVPANLAAAASAGKDGLANGTLRDLVSGIEAGNAESSLTIEGGSVRVEVLHSLSPEEIRGVVAALGGEVYGEVPGELVEALVPVGSLVALESQPGVDYVRPPIRASIPIDPDGPLGATAVPAGTTIMGEEVTKMNADDWHAAGITGQGARIGIIDTFEGGLWDAAQAAGELPEPAGMFCRVMGQDCDVFNLFPDAAHGEGVAEVIHEMAPDAGLYLATVYTASDIAAATSYFQAQGVQIISRSETSEYDGPGDGSGPIASAVDDAIDSGMVWLNAAGNASGTDVEPGGYWRGGWSDPDDDGFLNFVGDGELLPFICGFVNGIRWGQADWNSGTPTDYDVYVIDDPIVQNIKAISDDNQATGAPPLENLLDEPTFGCAPGLDIDFLVIALYDPGNGTGNDTLEFLTNTRVLDQWSNPYSASGPMVDSANPGMVAVGAIDPALGTAIATYSSWGPTNDNRTKPDVSAAACFDSYTYYPDCFNGTSSATPAVAGAAALILDSGIVAAAGGSGPGTSVSSPAALADYIRNSTVDRGQSGTDSVYGHGEVILGEPPDDQASPTPGPTVSPPPGPTATPTPTPGPTVSPPPGPTATPTPTASPPAGSLLTWGDTDCGGLFNIGDAINVSRRLVNLPVNQAEDCPTLGSPVIVDGTARTWGDMDCSLLFNIGDAINVSRRLVNLVVNKQPGCPTMGDIVMVEG